MGCFPALEACTAPEGPVMESPQGGDRLVKSRVDSLSQVFKVHGIISNTD